MALPIAQVDTSGGHRKGDGKSVIVVEFSDFECGHCAKAFRELKQVLPRFKKDVTLVFHHFPLNSSCNPAVDGSFHRFACLAAMASECAAEQGRFWEYHDLLFANQSSLDRDSLLEYADRLGLKREEFVACLESDRVKQRVENDVREASRLKIESTPTFFLNGRTVLGALDAEKLEYAIRLERAQRRAPS
jgi:protein-disulfide isomerase